MIKLKKKLEDTIGKIYDDEIREKFLIERNNEEYILSKYSLKEEKPELNYLAIIVSKNNNEKIGEELYNYYEYNDNKTNKKIATQNFKEIDNDFLKDISEFTQKKVFSETELMVDKIKEAKKYVEENDLKFFAHTGDENIRNVFNDLYKYIDKFETLINDFENNLIEKNDIKNNRFNIYLDGDMAYTNDKKFLQVLGDNSIKKIEERIIDIKGQEFFDKMDMSNIEDWAKLQEENIINLYYEGKDTMKEYTNRDDYIKEITKKELVNEFVKNPENIKKLETKLNELKIIENEKNKKENKKENIKETQKEKSTDIEIDM